MQGNALARESAAYRADIAAEQARHAAWTARTAEQQTSDYVREKARDYGYIGANETLIAVEKSGQPSAGSTQTISTGFSRIARWIAFFFGAR